jgi:hypothetical protein
MLPQRSVDETDACEDYGRLGDALEETVRHSGWTVNRDSIPKIASGQFRSPRRRTLSEQPPRSRAWPSVREAYLEVQVNPGESRAGQDITVTKNL